MYRTYTPPRAMAARWLIKGDEIACVMDWRKGKPAMFPLRAAESVADLGDLVRWYRVDSGGLAEAKVALKMSYHLGHALHPINTYVLMVELNDEDGATDEHAPPQAFYLDDRAGVVMRQSVVLDELDFVEYCIKSITGAAEDADALRALDDMSDEEGQRESAGLTSAEVNEYAAILQAPTPHESAIGDARLLALVGEGPTRRLPMRILPHGVQGVELGERERPDEESTRARGVDEEVGD